MTVYVVQDPTHKDPDTGQIGPKFDLTPALEYGPLSFLLKPRANPLRYTDTIVRDLWKGLRDFTPEDHLLLLGNPCLIGMAVAVAVEMTGGPITMLQWSGKEKRYLPVRANIYNRVLEKE